MTDVLLFSAGQTRIFPRPLREISVTNGSVLVTEKAKLRATAVEAGETLGLNDTPGLSISSMNGASIVATHAINPTNPAVEEEIVE